jgi:sterol desaturase/sphingolipid hydroxylase (fatty acid hydroxylase superfamily)
MHHADLDVDVTTGARFHPVEILLSRGIKFLVIVTLGAPAPAVLIFEIALNATSMFNHSNVRMPPAIERVLRWLADSEVPPTKLQAGFLRCRVQHCDGCGKRRTGVR